MNSGDMGGGVTVCCNVILVLLYSKDIIYISNLVVFYSTYRRST